MNNKRGMAMISIAGPVVYVTVSLEGEHWTRVQGGFVDRKGARKYLQEMYPGAEVLDHDAFVKRLKVQDRAMGVRAGIVYPEEPPEPEVLPDGPIATIMHQDTTYLLLLLKEKKIRAVSGLESEEETKEMWSDLYSSYILVSYELFEKVRKRREI